MKRILALLTLCIELPVSTLAVSAVKLPPEVRATNIFYRLATRGLRRCPHPDGQTGIQWQTIGQFAPKERLAAAHAFHINLGPRVIAVAVGSPAALAGITRDDTLLAINDHDMAPPRGQLAAVGQAANLSTIDAIDARLVASAQPSPMTVVILHDGVVRTLTLKATEGCPSHLYVAQSDQLDAYADGLHILLPRGLIERIGDDDQLALLIAHELAHNILGHRARLRASTGATRRAVAKVEENEADALGVDLAIDAGYDVVRGSRVFLMGGGESSAHRAGGDRQRLAVERAQQRNADSAPSR